MHRDRAASGGCQRPDEGDGVSGGVQHAYFRHDRHGQIGGQVADD